MKEKLIQLSDTVIILTPWALGPIGAALVFEGTYTLTGGFLFLLGLNMILRRDG